MSDRSDCDGMKTSIHKWASAIAWPVRWIVVATVILASSVVGMVAAPSETAFASGVAPTWTIQANYPLFPKQLNNVSCTSASFCQVMGWTSTIDGYALSWNGSTWSQETLPPDVSGLNGISCTSASFCQAVGYGDVLSWNGSIWKLETLPSDIINLHGISCTSASFCQAVGWTGSNTGAALSWNGSTWSQETLPSGTSMLSGVSCTSATFCQAVGGYIPTLPAPPGTALSWNGVTWSQETLPSGISALDNVSCTSSTFCQAVGDTSTMDITALSWNGVTWSQETLPSNLISLHGVSCTSATFCQAVGLTGSDTGTVLSWNGVTWSQETLPSSMWSPYGISCTSATFCQAVGLTGSDTGTALSWNGVTWSSETLPSGVIILSDVSCTSATFCQAVEQTNNGGGALSWNGSIWSSETLPSAAISPSGVSCTSATFCQAVGNSTLYGSGSGDALSWNGGTWSQETLPSSVDYLYSVSCTSATFCQAVGGHNNSITGAALSWNGVTWTSESLPSGIDTLNSVSCTSASFCQAVGNSPIYGSSADYALSWNGVTWSQETLPSAAISPSGVSCTSATFCQAVGQTNTGVGTNSTPVAFSWNGGTWTWETLPSNLISLHGVSCTSATFCQVVGQTNTGAGAVLSWNGVTWSQETLPSGVDSASSVSCVLANACMAVGVTSTDVVILTTMHQTAPSAPSVTSVSPSSGSTSGDTPVTITGSNLSGATSVDFGSTAATNVKVLSSTEITVASPAGTGTVPVTVRTPVGTSSSFLTCGDSFTYGAPAGSPQPGSYTPISPFRVADTRPNSGEPYAGKTLQGCSTLSVQVTGLSGSNVPSSGVSAIVANVTAVGPSQAGYLTVYPAGSARPVVSNLNFSPGKTVANLIEIPVSSTGQIAIYNGSADSTNVVVDVEGYVGPTGDSYTPITPLRVCDTRSNNPSNLSGEHAQCNGKTLSPNTPLTISMTGTGLLPISATAAIINLTAIAPVGGGYLTAYPPSSTPPTASNVNFTKGELISNRAVVQIPSSGEIDIVSNTATNVVVDVVGYYSISGSSYTPLSPRRIADSRCSSGAPPVFCASENIPPGNLSFSPIGGGSTENLTVAGIGSVPLTATAVVLNITVASTTRGSFLTVWPAEAPSMPTASDLNWAAGTTIPNLVVAEVGTNDQISIYNNAGSVDVIVDIEGYYSASP